jgi:carbamate kinase
MPWQVATIVTQVVVDEGDPAFGNPTKPIGAFYDEDTAKKMMADDPSLKMKEDSGRGWRVLVPSPKPMDIVEKKSILNLLDNEYIVIACGGGGIPVLKKENGDLEGTAAVIDKDFAAELLAEKVEADALMILTEVEKVAINFNKPDQENLGHMTYAEAQKHCDDGQFAPGSMLPKVMAAMKFVKANPGKKAIITSLAKAIDALEGKTGTVVTFE